MARERYSNPDSDGGDGTTEATTGEFAAYVSLAAAEVAEDAADPVSYTHLTLPTTPYV